MPQIQDHILADVASAFGYKSPIRIDSIGEGLINSTFRITGELSQIVIQRLNSNVFNSPSDIIENYFKIADHLHKLSLNLIPGPIKTIDNKKNFRDKTGEYWRGTEYINVRITLNETHSPDHACQAASCFGRLTKSLAGLHQTLKVIIPGFHDLSFRYRQFEDALNKNAVGRKMSIRNEMEQLISKHPLVELFENIKSSGQYKLRVMHHDAKPDNILFDDGGAAIIVDLDTCQPGYYFSDIGDMIRSMVPSQPEHSSELEKLNIREEIYDSLISGYLMAMEDELTPSEKKHIHKSGPIMIYMQALRFYTDYLNGDIYYKIGYEQQNLDRGRNQLHFLLKLEAFLSEFH